MEQLNTALNVSDEDMSVAPPDDARLKSVLDLFIAEYLIDFDPVNAALRIGFYGENAEKYSRDFMLRPYVASRINQLRYGTQNQKAVEDFNKKRIVQRLMEEAHNTGKGSTHAGRVQALTQLAKLYGMEATKKSETTVTHRGGVMLAPGAVSLNDWEAAATASQEALVRDARG